MTRVLSKNPDAIKKHKQRAKQKQAKDTIEKAIDNKVKLLKKTDKKQKPINFDEWEKNSREPYLGKEPKPQFEDSEDESFDPYYNNMFGTGINPDNKNKRSHADVFKSIFGDRAE